MWPLDREQRRECLRIGKHAAQRWQAVAGGLKVVASQALALDAFAQPEELVASVRALYPTPPHRAVALVVESACLPVILVDTGGTLWSAAQVEGLVRHRLGLLYDDGADKVATWPLRIDHRAGDRYAFGGGLPQRVHQALAEVSAFELPRASLTPAFCWSWQRFRPDRAWARRTGWFICLEQDRAIAARIERGTLTGLDAGAARCEDADQVEGLVRTLALRMGVRGAPGPVAVASWEFAGARQVRRHDLTIQWLSVATGSRSVRESPAPIPRRMSPST